MAATVKPIEAKSVHQIQSGQVIVDLCSVVKELVENSLDANATAIEVRFKNHGLGEIEVQDNGTGIASANYESVALKHYTSKLSTYDDLSSLQTFGFRGEALSSLCALSNFTITTAQAHEAPKGHRLDFEISGRLKGTTLVACQTGTTATVQGLFEKLPVRRKELAKNIKREYGKVLGLLHAYACISTNVKFTVKNAVSKAKTMTIFATKSNATTRENIANVYGAKTLSALAPLNLTLDFEQSLTQHGSNAPEIVGVTVCGHISKPVFGEGRQTPDRQMFFVNGRPCGLPQIAKAINEVYKSFNVSQSPFIFADFLMDTGAYDVNVSPDKRTIFLHNAGAMIESLKNALTEMFDQQDQTVPQSQLQTPKLPSYKQLSLQRNNTNDVSSKSSPAGTPIHEDQGDVEIDSGSVGGDETRDQPGRLLHNHFQQFTGTREDPEESDSLRGQRLDKDRQRRAKKIAESWASNESDGHDGYDNNQETQEQSMLRTQSERTPDAEDIHVRDFKARMNEAQTNTARDTSHEQDTIPGGEKSITSISVSQPAESPGVVQNAFHHMRPKKFQSEVATITIGDKTFTKIVGPQASQPSSRKPVREDNHSTTSGLGVDVKTNFAQGLQKFGAPGSQVMTSDLQVENEEDSVGRIHTPVNAQFSEEQDSLPDRSSDTGIEATVDRGLVSAVDSNIMSAMGDVPVSVNEDDEKAAERARVNELIRSAEENASLPKSKSGEKRTAHALVFRRNKESITSLSVEVVVDIQALEVEANAWSSVAKFAQEDNEVNQAHLDTVADSAEERLSLTISKSDFACMHIVGQFNLGFILAVRSKMPQTATQKGKDYDELFIIDQHASDEKYNFERLQTETVVGNQRMVRPALLDLTAVEEEIVIDSRVALEKNGFIVDVDTSGQQEVGKRCQLVSLPLSKEVVFGTQDLDELIHLLAESPMLNDSSPVPRPSKVRKMFAMRACRSSIMIGKTLSRKQMSNILLHMGSIDKPWNCPHGRPTMRHLASLDTLEASLWKEGDGITFGETPGDLGLKSAADVWKSYAK